MTAPVVIETSNRLSLLQGLRELWTFREVIWAFAERDIRVKYKQAVLGILWVALQPLAFLLIFSIVFGRFAGVWSGSANYPAATLAALVPWFFVHTAVSFGAQALLMDAALVRKVYFPREAPVLGAVFSATLDFAVGLGVLALLGSWLGARISWSIALVLPLWLILAVLATGMALGLGGLTIYYRDFRYVLPLVLQLWMFASPVAYPVSLVPEWLRGWYVAVNPAAGILEGFRDVVVEGRLPAADLVALSAVGAAVVLMVGYLIFKTLEPGFADAI